MATVLDGIDHDLAAWIAAQRLFFVATAPLAADGHVDCSLKGTDTLRVLDERTVAYLDLTGSGAETAAHLRENGRICLMLCAFDGPPKIVRLYGAGAVHPLGSDRFAALADRWPPLPGARAVVEVALARVQSSCGFAVPRFDFASERTILLDFARRKGPDGMAAYRDRKNLTSIDGLPAFD